MKLPGFLALDRLGRVRKLALYGAFGVVVFLLSFYLSFPYHRVKDQIIAMASQQNLDVEITEAGPALGMGISLDDIKVATRPVDGSKPTRFQIESAEMTMSPLAQLFGSAAYALVAEAFGGEIDMDYRMSKTRGDLKVDARGLAMAQMPGVREALNIPLGGTLNLDVDVGTPNHRNSEAAGKVKWTCAACAVGDGKAKLKIANNPMMAEGLLLPRLRLGDFVGSIVIEKGVGKFQGVRARSPDGELNVEGEIRLVDPLPLSYLDVYVTFKLSDALLKSSDKLAILLQFAETAGKRPDGLYGFRVSGPLRSLGPPLWSKTSPFGSSGSAAPRPSTGGPRQGAFRTPTPPSSPTPPSPSEPAPPTSVQASTAGAAEPAPTLVDPAKTPNANMPRYRTEPPAE